jgi:hypothetical protein
MDFRYHEKYHPYFPVAHRSIFDNKDVMDLTEQEPHLLCAILTVASKDEPSYSKAHSACSVYMESLISGLINRGTTSVGAVEALLILAEWAPQRLQEKPTIGRGEEDQGSWMQVGCAVRLGYLQRLEETGLLQAKGLDSDQLSRKRLVWAGTCFISSLEYDLLLVVSLLYERSTNFHPSRQRILVSWTGTIHSITGCRLPFSPS